MTTFLPGLGISSWVALASVAGAQELRGSVVDGTGQPASGARVSRSWRFADPAVAADGALPEAFGPDDLHKPVVADERGEFLVPKADGPFLFVLSADGRSGALPQVDARNGARLDVALAPLVDVRGRFEVKTPVEPPKKVAFWVNASTGVPAFVAVCISESRAFRVSLPAGSYTLWYSTDAVDLWTLSMLREEPLVIPPGQAAIDLGSFELELPLLLHPQGVVLDAAGKPARASLGENWHVLGGRMSPWSGFESDEHGRFRGSIEVQDANAEVLLLALDAKREHAALAVWKPSESDKPLEIRLRPAVRLSGRYRTSAGDAPTLTNTYIQSVQAGGEKAWLPRVAECQSEEARFEFRLPPGKYRLEGYGSNTTSKSLDLELGPDALERDLGVIELPQTVIARNVGKAAPAWHVTDARGLPKEVKLADFRGKWVLLEFWGHW